MATNRLPPAGAPTGENAATTSTPAAAGGFQSWLPLLVVLLVMPAVAYAMTTFVLVPKLRQSLGPAAGEAAPAAHKAGANGAAARAPAAAGAKADKLQMPLSKVLVNVAGSMGTRYLLTTMTLVGSDADFKTKVEEHKAQLLDVAASTLSSKTISDLEKPGARNLIRTELISVFNNAIGGGLIQEIYFTEFAIQ